MLKSLSIKNFQAHDNLTIDFDKHINVIVGASDTGKSAIIRSLRWNCFNQPSGDEFIQWGKDSVKTKVITDDGNVVVRAKTRSKNLYSLNGEEYASFGTQVPAPIKNVLKLDDINFQQQHDSPFWFSETAGEVSRRLNEIVNLEIIDKTMSKINSKIRANTAVKRDVDLQISKTESKVQEYDYLSEMDSDLEAVEKLKEKREEFVNDYTYLDGLIRRLSSLNKTLKTNKAIVKVGQEAAVVADEWKTVRDNSLQLAKLLKQIKDCQRSIRQAPPAIGKLPNYKDEYDALQQQYNALSLFIKQYAAAIAKAEQLRKVVVDLEQEKIDVFGDVCPLCNNPMAGISK